MGAPPPRSLVSRSEGWRKKKGRTLQYGPKCIAVFHGVRWVLSGCPHRPGEVHGTSYAVYVDPGAVTLEIGIWIPTVGKIYAAASPRRRSEERRVGKESLSRR